MAQNNPGHRNSPVWRGIAKYVKNENQYKIVEKSCLIPFKHPICPPAFVSVVFAIPFKLAYGEKQSISLTKNGFVASGSRKREFASSTITAKPIRRIIAPRTALKIKKIDP